MVNEPLLDYKFIPPCPPSNDIKTNESEAIARHIAEFLARGGSIKQAAGNQLAKEKNFMIGGNAYTGFHELGRVKEAMRDKNIRKEELAKAAKVNLKLLGEVLAGQRLPDANEKRNIMAVLGIV